MSSDDEFLQAFEACAIPHAEWTHRAHLRMAYCMLRRHPFEEALVRVRAGIQKLNTSHETPELIDRGYHETVTIAWLRILAASIRQRGALESAETFFAEQAHLTQRTLLRLFYSRERMMTWDAKKSFVEPDLLPLPTP